MFLTMVPLLLATTATPAPSWQLLWAQCRNEPVAAVRLACYDALGREAAGFGPDSVSEEGFRLAREADSDDMTLTRTLIGGNTLVINCTSNITHLRLVLHHPWVGQTVWSQLDGLTEESTWFVRSRGHLLESGRGLPAITTLKRWVGHQELVLNDAAGKVLVIDLAGLGEALHPLRKQCHW